MLIDRANLPRHGPWIVFVLVVTALASVWFLVYTAGSLAWTCGSSPPGLVFGIIGGLVILFEFLLWPRKKFRVWRIGRTEAWLRAHIWLGLLSLPLIVFHSGFRMGGTLSTVLMILFLVVIASGVVGLALQQFVPSRMLESVSAETIYSQIDHVLSQLRVEADRLVRATCGSVVGEPAARLVEAHASQATDAPLTVGAIGHVGRVRGRVVHAVVPTGPVPSSELLQVTYDRVIAPYLRDGTRSGSALHSAKQAEGIFDDLLTKLDPAAHPAVRALAGLCEQRRQLDQQARLHFWLHSWLLIHLPLSIALVALMFVHVWYALEYW